MGVVVTGTVGIMLIGICVNAEWGLPEYFREKYLSDHSLIKIISNIWNNNSTDEK